MKNRHKAHKNVGGATAYSGGSSNVAKEAKSTGGGFKSGGKVHGAKSKMRLDKRARGGRTGGSPFSSAHTSEKGNLTSKR